MLILRLVSNLIDNAVRHNVSGGRIQVATGTSCGPASLSVTSSGPVIPAAEVDRLFQPFQRLGTRRARGDGHGLGLSIVRAIAIAHGAIITAQPVPGGGLAVAVSFAQARACGSAADRSATWADCSPASGRCDTTGGMLSA